MTLMTSIRRKAMMTRLLHVGGTIKSCRRAALKHHNSRLQQMSLNDQQRSLGEAAKTKLMAMDL